MQRLPSVAVRCWVHGARHEAGIGSTGNAAVSMTDISGAAVIQRGRPQVAPPTRVRMSPARSDELKPSTQTGRTDISMGEQHQAVWS